MLGHLVGFVGRLFYNRGYNGDNMGLYWGYNRGYIEILWGYNRELYGDNLDKKMETTWRVRGT